MYQVSRYSASMTQRKIFNYLDKFIRNCPTVQRLIINQKDYEHLLKLVPEVYRKKRDLKIGYEGRELVCR